MALPVLNGYLGDAVKADKGGVQAGEAGLQQRCGKLETALLQGLQQVRHRDLGHNSAC